MKFFDYIYYRVAKFYFKSDGLSANRAIISISSIQVLSVLSLILIISHPFLTLDDTKAFGYGPEILIGCSFFFICFLNERKYKGTFLNFRELWINEPQQIKFWRGIGVVLSLLLPWIVFCAILKYLPIRSS